MKLPRALNNTNIVMAWVAHGMNYGYPPCCIGEFVIHCIKNTYKKRETRKLNGTGYVPCCKCNAKFTEKELIQNINRARNLDMCGLFQKGTK